MTDKLLIAGVALGAAAIAALLVYAMFRTQINEMLAGAKAAAQKDILSGAAQAAAAANEALAAARDPEALDNALAAGNL